MIILAYPCLLTLVLSISLTGLLYLTTRWSQAMRILLTLRKGKSGEYILFENTLCRVRSRGVKHFVYKRSFYIIDKTILKLENATDIPINEFKDVIEEMGKAESIKPDQVNKNELSDSKDTLKDNKVYVDVQKITQQALKPKTKKDRICAINRLYGFLGIPNDFDYQPPSFISLFIQHATAPLFVFQIFCSLLWCLDEYPYHALFTMVMQVLFEAGIVFTRLRNLKEFGTLRLRATKVSDLRQGIKSSRDLRPGDVIRISTAGVQVPCDMIILSGSAAVCEAMLTGESTIVKKDEICEEDSRTFSDETHKRNILYGGTEIVKIGLNKNAESDNEDDVQFVDCYVLRTGFDTQQGALIKTMMEGEEVGINNKEAFMFILCLLFFAIIASFYVIKAGIENGKDVYKILLEVIMILTNVVPPELPMEMTLAVNSALQSLLQLNVFCLESFKIPTAGKVDVCCFDKTGTLTEVALSVVKIMKHDNDEGFVELEQGTLKSVDHDEIKLAIACCHSLIVLRGFRGDPLEESIFRFLNLKLRSEDVSSDDKYQYKALKKYQFTSELRRMTVVTEKTCKNSEVFVCMKGAPEVVMSYLEKVPDDYFRFEEMSSMGYRVIALATKKYKYKQTYNRADVEKNLQFVGFVLYDCKIKADTNEAIRILKESAHKLVMITGDNLLTAMCVAKKVGMIDNIEHEDIQIHDKNRIKNGNENGIENRIENGNDMNENDRANKVNDNIQVNDKVKETMHIEQENIQVDGKLVHYVGDIGVEGDEIDKVLASDDFYKYNVFARANPKQKEDIIMRYKLSGSVTLMCGDGTNDVGALKTADVGVALVDGKVTNKKSQQRGMTEEDHVKLGDASVAAPFTAKTGTIMAVVDIIRQGRSTLVTTIQMYKILGLNSLISAYSLSILDCMGIRYGDVQMTISGILIAFAFMFLTRSKTLKDISRKRPVDNIFNKYIVTSVVLQTIVHVVAFTALLRSGIVSNSIEYVTDGFGMKSPLINDLYAESQLIQAVDIKPEDKNKFRPSILNSAVFLLSVSQQINTFIINYIGRPFRESLIENTRLNLSLFSVLGIVIGLVFEINEGFSRMMEIVPLGEYKWIIFMIIGVDFGVCYVVEKICFYLFML